MRGNKILKLLSMFMLIILGLVIFIYFSFYDKAVTSGTGFGYSIDMSKSDAFYRAKELYNDEKVYTLHLISSPGSGPVEIKFTNEDYLKIMNHSKWVFYFDENLNDFLRLTFDNEKLVRIYRHNYLIELP